MFVDVYWAGLPVSAANDGTALLITSRSRLASRAIGEKPEKLLIMKSAESGTPLNRTREMISEDQFGIKDGLHRLEAAKHKGMASGADNLCQRPQSRGETREISPGFNR